MKQEEAYEATEGDIISLVYNSDYQYKVTFEGSTNMTSKSKRTSDEELMSEEPKKVKSEGVGQWGYIDGGNCYVYTPHDTEGRTKIAAYDMDNTLIKTVSGNVFPKNIDDWQLNYERIPKKLKTLHENGFKIVVFTNQAGIESGKMLINNLKRKIAMIQQRLEVPCQFFIATGATKYRKPRISMWETLVNDYNEGVEIDKSQSFYVGDAAGRPENKILKRKKDHSLADRLFAMNLKLSFYTPEEHFLNDKEISKYWSKPAFDPTNLNMSLDLLQPADAKLISGHLEIILLVGFPGSGKSVFSQEHFAKQGYEIINRDTLNSAQRCVAAISSSLQKKKSCVIDNTNPDPASRKKFIEEAKKNRVPIRCFLMNTTYEQAKHNNIFRELTDSTHEKIGDMVFHIYKKKYVEPTTKEGFTEIVRVNFIPKFKNEDDEKLYTMYLVEK